MSEAETPKEVKKSDVAEAEEKVLEFWQREQIFEKSLQKDAPKGDFVFYDGPPYGTGTPHYGHLLAGTIKDIIPRYKTMQGYHVPRRWGWDCHGLPIENLIEKELDLSTKQHIEEYGIDKFNAAAKASVLRYASEWETMVPRTGRWVDMRHPYMTMQPSFMESVWWVFKSLHDKGLVSQGFKPMHICPRCQTPLANFEVNLGYADVTDITVTAKFELVDEPGTYVLAWTTTPWTLPGNVALAVGEEVEYVAVSHEGHRYIVAKALAEKVFKDKEYEVGESFKGVDLVGKAYRPVFEYYTNDETLEYRENGWRIYAADFVTTDEGTGIVHIAPAFGSDDMELGKVHNLPFIQHVGMDGVMKPAVTDFAGMPVKKKGDTMTTDIEIVKWLAHNDKLFSKEKYVHSYPLCWRCDTPLLNYATKSWFVDVPAIKDKLLANNAKTTWVPEHLRDGRFGKWLEGAREWAVSRSRYWGTPLPVWEHADSGKHIVIGSIADLAKYQKKSGNEYMVMRHGQAESNVLGVVSARKYDIHPLTEQGQNEAEAGAKKLEDKAPDLIVVSPLLRTRQTAEIVRGHLGLSEDQVIVDDRLREQDPGIFEGKQWRDYHDFLAGHERNWFTTPVPEGESYAEIRTRVGDLLYELDAKHAGKRILFVAHGGVSWILETITGQHTPNGHSYEASQENTAFVPGYKPLVTGEVRELPFAPMPHDETYGLDLHRPFIDHVILVDEEGNEYHRVPEVFDVWFDSGSMPYAQAHYPFENKEAFEQGLFPANFIAEGLDQTRGWFYTLMVLATALFDKPAFEQVLVNGLVLAEDGKKMSKSLKNFPDPWDVLNTLGADAVRLFMISQPLVRAESSAFTEKGVQDMANKVVRRLKNVVAFYELNKDGEHKEDFDSHVLDTWMGERLKEFSAEVTASLEAYELDRGVRAILSYVDDLSTWYVRRSRDRFKDEVDAPYARGVLRRVLIETAKILAPYAPFMAEEIWQRLDVDEAESVHLVVWPELGEPDAKVLEAMQQTRDLVSQALELRSSAGIKVRQPLARLSIPVELHDALKSVIEEEVNVKEVATGGELALDTDITPELAAEGAARELVRHLQSLRKQADLEVGQEAAATVATNVSGRAALEAHLGYIESSTQLSIEVATLADEADAEVTAGDAAFSATLNV